MEATLRDDKRPKKYVITPIGKKIIDNSKKPVEKNPIVDVVGSVLTGEPISDNPNDFFNKQKPRNYGFESQPSDVTSTETTQPISEDQNDKNMNPAVNGSPYVNDKRTVVEDGQMKDVNVYTSTPEVKPTIPQPEWDASGNLTIPGKVATIQEQTHAIISNGLNSIGLDPTSDMGIAIGSALNPIVEGFQQIKRGENEKSANTGLLDGILGLAKLGIGMMPQMAGVNFISPMVTDVAGNVAETLGLDRQQGEKVGQMISFAPFGKAVMLAGLVSETGGEFVSSLIKNKDLSDIDKERIVELASQVGFFTGLGLQGMSKKVYRNIRNRVDLRSDITKLNPQQLDNAMVNEIQKERTNSIIQTLEKDKAEVQKQFEQAQTPEERLQAVNTLDKIEKKQAEYKEKLNPTEPIKPESKVKEDNPKYLAEGKDMDILEGVSDKQIKEIEAKYPDAILIENNRDGSYSLVGKNSEKEYIKDFKDEKELLNWKTKKYRQSGASADYPTFLEIEPKGTDTKVTSGLFPPKPPKPKETSLKSEDVEVPKAVEVPFPEDANITIKKSEKVGDVTPPEPVKPVETKEVPVAVEKKPYEMTDAELIKYTEDRYVSDFKKYPFDDPQDLANQRKVNTYDDLLQYYADAEKKRGRNTPKELIDSVGRDAKGIRQMRIESIKDTFAGKTIPEEILKDYPELPKPPQPKPKRTPKPVEQPKGEVNLLEQVNKAVEDSKGVGGDVAKLKEMGYEVDVTKPEQFDESFRSMTKTQSQERNTSRSKESNAYTLKKDLKRPLNQVEEVSRIIFKDKKGTYKIPVDKLGEFKVKLEKSNLYEKAKKDLGKLPDKLSAFPVDYYAKQIKNLATIGKYHIENGAKAFTKWAKEMVKDVGEWIRPKLRTLWNELTKDRTGLPNMVANGVRIYRGQRKGQPFNKERGTWFSNDKVYAQDWADHVFRKGKVGGGEVISETVKGKVLEFPYEITAEHPFFYGIDELAKHLDMTKDKLVELYPPIKNIGKVGYASSIRPEVIIENNKVREYLRNKGYDYIKAKDTSVMDKRPIDVYLKINENVGIVDRLKNPNRLPNVKVGGVDFDYSSFKRGGKRDVKAERKMIEDNLRGDSEPKTVHSNAKLNATTRQKVLASDIFTKGDKKAGKDVFNYDKFSTKEQLNDLVEQSAKENKPEIDAQKRDIRTWAKTSEGANILKAMGWDENSLMRAVKGDSFLAERILASKDFINTAGHELLKAMQELPKTADAKVELADKFMKYNVMVKNTKGLISEAGRALNIVKRKSAEDVKMKIDLADELVRLGLEGDDIAGLDKALKIIDATAQDKIYYWWYNSMLSNPLTDVANIGGNVTHFSWELMQTAITENPRTTLKILQDIKNAHGTGVDEVKRIFRGQENTESKFDYKDRIYAEAFTPKSKFGKAVKSVLPTTRLAMEDAYFRNLAGGLRKYKTLREISKETGDSMAQVQSLLDAVYKNPELALLDKKFEVYEKHLKALERYIDFLVFQTPLGEGGKFIQHGINKIPVLKTTMPFMKIAVNLTKAGIRQTPYGLKDLVFKKDLTPLEKKDVIRRAVLGSVFFAGIGKLMADDIIEITGHGVDDRDKRELWYKQGYRENHFYIKVNGEKYGFSYTNINPVNTLLSIIGSYSDDQKYNQTKKDAELNIIEKGTKALLGAVEVLTTQSFMQGMANTIDMIKNNDPEMIKKSLQNMFSPSILSFPRDVSNYIKGDKKQYETKTALDRLKDKTGMTEGLKPKLNQFGEEKTSSLQRFPYPVTKLKSDEPLTDFLVKNEIEIAYPNKNTKLGDDVMTEDQYYEYVKLSGPAIKKALSEKLTILNSFATAEERDKATHLIVDTVREQVRENMKAMTKEEIEAKKKEDKDKREDNKDMKEKLGLKTEKKSTKSGKYKPIIIK